LPKLKAVAEGAVVGTQLRIGNLIELEQEASKVIPPVLTTLV
jgi:hypothetical protein